MNDKIKKPLIIAGIAIGSIMLIVLAVVLYVMNEKISYGVKYYDEYGSQYFIFNSDGSCEGSSNVVDCSYTIQDEKVVIKTHIDSTSLLGYNAEYTYEFDILNKQQLKRSKMSVIGYDLTTGLGDIWEVGRKDFKTTTTEATKPYYKKYNILTLKNGKKATITFDKAGSCKVNFNQFNNNNIGKGSGTSRNYLSTTYYDGQCSYEVIDDKNLIINYTGTVDIATHWYMDYNKTMQKTIMGSYKVLDKATITFDDNYSSFKFTNGEFVGQTGEIFYYYYKLNEKEEEKTTTTVAKGDDTSDSTTKKTTTKKIDKETPTTTSRREETTKATTTSKATTTTTTTTEKVKNVDTISVNLRDSQGLYYCVYLSSNGDYYAKNDDYLVSVNNESFNINPGFPAACYKYTKKGNHCLDVTVTDSDGFKKTFNNKCINFTPEKLNYSASVSSGYGGYYIRLSDKSEVSRNNKEHYNNSNKVTVYLDGEKVSSTFYVGVVFKDCNHTIKVTNKYGDSQTINLTC